MRDGVAQLSTNLGRDILRARLLGTAPPMVAGRYRVDRILGRGASGVVVEAVDTAVGLPRALKMAPVGPATSGAYDEARTLMQLEDAANVVRVYHVDRARLVTCSFESTVDFVSMKLVRGPTLRTWLATTKPSVDVALEKFIDVARGLVEAHALGIVHGDVKTDNVMVDETGRALLLDFGFAAQIRSGQAGVQRSVALGTGPYLAPEVRKGTVRRRSDVYSFAVSLWEAWTGTLPFEGDVPEVGWFGGVKNLLHGETLPRSLRDKLRWCLNPKPSVRPKMIDVLGALEAIGDQLKVAPHRQPRRSWRPWLVAGTACLAAVIYLVPTARWRVGYVVRDKVGRGAEVPLRFHHESGPSDAPIESPSACSVLGRADLRFRRLATIAKITQHDEDWSASSVDWSSDRLQMTFGREGCQLTVDVPVTSSTREAPIGTFEILTRVGRGEWSRSESGRVTFGEETKP